MSERTRLFELSAALEGEGDPEVGQGTTEERMTYREVVAALRAARRRILALEALLDQTRQQAINGHQEQQVQIDDLLTRVAALEGGP